MIKIRVRIGKIDSGQMRPGASGSNSLRAFIRVRNISQFTGIIFRIHIEWTAFAIKRIVFISIETQTKARRVLSRRETNAILFYTTKIICQIYIQMSLTKKLKDISKISELSEIEIVKMLFLILFACIFVLRTLCIKIEFSRSKIADHIFEVS